MTNITCVKSDDEKHLILCGSMSRLSYSAQMYIMNVKTFEFKQCKMRCPNKIGSIFGLVLMNNFALNKVLIHGYLRNI